MLIVRMVVRRKGKKNSCDSSPQRPDHIEQNIPSLTGDEVKSDKFLGFTLENETEIENGSSSRLTF